ncbi:hypothetical protein OG218_20820 [Kineococcus sp. NBC_00420]|uniref:hypothetical protein n=1 Tax=Kineococcus sp. NBC_00420 TaxID=2903564 RepID=UPI002E1F7879
MSFDPYAPHVPNAALHTQLLDALRSDAAVPVLRVPDEGPDAASWLDLLPESATSRHSRVVGAVLGGGPVAVDAGEEAATFVAGLLAVLLTHGADVGVLAGSSAARVATEVSALGVPLLDGVTPAPLPVAVADDPQRWAALVSELEQRAARPAEPVADGAPSLFEAVAELVALRAQHVHPPLQPGAATWSASAREGIAEALQGGTGAAADPLAGRSEDEVAAVTALPTQLRDLTSLTERLVLDLAWHHPRTLADVDRALELLGRVEAARSTYLPAAFRTDLARAREVLTRPQRSFLSSEERDRRREVKRLAGLRHDGAFGVADVDALQVLQDAWAEQSSGTPTTWPVRADLAGQVELVRRSLRTAAGTLSGVPADLDEFEVAEFVPLAEQAESLTDTPVREPLPIGAPELDELRSGLPTGASAADVGQFVRAVWLRALTEERTTGPSVDPGRELRELATGRRIRAAEGLRAVVTDGTVRPARTATPDGGYDVLVVVDAQEFETARVLDLAGRARQLVVVRSTGAADPGSVWTRTVRSVEPHELGWPAVVATPAIETFRESLAAALRGTVAVTTGEVVAGRAVDLVVAARTGELPVLAVDLDGPAYAALGTVRDREIARPARLADARVGHLTVPALDWFRDPRGTTRRITDALARFTDLDRAREEPVAEEPVAEEPVAEEPVAEEPVAEEPVAEEPVAEEPVAEEPVAEEPVAEEPVAEEPVAEEPVAEEPVAEEPVAEEPVELELPRGLGSAADAETRVAEFLAGLNGGHPNVDQTPPAVVDAAVALTFARLGLEVQEQALLDGAMDVIGFRRRGIKVIRAFKESVQRSKKRMRGAGLKIN